MLIYFPSIQYSRLFPITIIIIHNLSGHSGLECRHGIIGNAPTDNCKALSALASKLQNCTTKCISLILLGTQKVTGRRSPNSYSNSEFQILENVKHEERPL